MAIAVLSKPRLFNPSLRLTIVAFGVTMTQLVVGSAFLYAAGINDVFNEAWYIWAEKPEAFTRLTVSSEYG